MNKTSSYTHNEKLAILAIATENNPKSECSIMIDTLFIDTMNDAQTFNKSEIFGLEEYLMSLPLPLSTSL